MANRRKGQDIWQQTLTIEEAEQVHDVIDTICSLSDDQQAALAWRLVNEKYEPEFFKKVVDYSQGVVSAKSARIFFEMFASKIKKFRRKPSSKAQKAATLRESGHLWKEIKNQLGFPTEQAAMKAVQRIKANEKKLAKLTGRIEPSGNS